MPIVYNASLENHSLVNTTAANTTTAANASTAVGNAAGAGGGGAGSLLGGAFGELLKGIGGGLGNAIPLVITAIVVIFLSLLVFRVLTTAVTRTIIEKLPQPLFKMPWLIEEPNERKLSYKVLYRIAPGIYASDDGSVVALARHDAQPLQLDIPLDKKVVNQHGTRAMYGVVIGDVVFHVEPAERLGFALFGDKLVEAGNIAELLITLKERGVVNDIVVSPNLKLVLTPGSHLPRFLAENMGNLAADTLVDVAAMTGSRQEFKAWVKQLIELEKQRVEEVSKGVGRIVILVFVAVLVLGLVFSFLGGQ